MKTPSANTPTKSYTLAQHHSDTDTVTLNTCGQLTTQNHENQIICGKTQLISLIHTAWQVDVFNQNKLYLSLFNIK